MQQAIDGIVPPTLFSVERAPLSTAIYLCVAIEVDVFNSGVFRWIHSSFYRIFSSTV